MKATILLLTYELLINVAMTAVFIVLLRPLLRLRNPAKAHQLFTSPSLYKMDTVKIMVRPSAAQTQGSDSTSSSSALPLPAPTLPAGAVFHSSTDMLKRLVLKSTFGAGFILLFTILNLGLLIAWRGQEQGWLCFTLCSLDGEFR